ncbi:MAG: tRNA (N(6)-L-threonylcarbamoyladenosine(37)-C(2))-methylthiotransferase MtaB [Eubacteriales bacterium]|nr:tRNA (N(6)-L-threonylcarbamoyladenosine(37)-C(2))-methylthiotransferase MtaB [Lachnospiraceae bacterium]MDO5126528.1 tRNA (N(6)-L-threonylcarbamoyladenosine(37)-C(2))-methylthiotransferase MtaB [Eubacteriales bacterium]
MFQYIKDKKIAINTLGCKVNQYESDSMVDMLASHGCEIVSFQETADVYIINTCAVTNMAERKSRQIIHRAKKQNPDAVIVVTGCYVQSEREAVETDEVVDLIIGNNRKNEIARILNSFFENKLPEDNYVEIADEKEYESMWLIKPHEHTRAYVKVQDGCNNFCSYCIIPYTRGRIRSRALCEVVKEITNLTQNGIREVVLTGINLSSYQDQDMDLLDLIQSVSKIEGLWRIRLGSLEPRIITERFLEGIYQDKKVCPHFHLSLQSACNATLKRMNRHYTIEEYIEKCAMIRKYFDRPAITTDIIVGFPGETDEEFAITEQNLRELSLYEMHIFKYSRRKNTVADRMPNQVSDALKEARSNCLLQMTATQKQDFENSFAEQKVSVLVEEIVKEDGKLYMKGHTDRYILVKQEIESEHNVEINSLVDVIYKKNKKN